MVNCLIAEIASVFCGPFCAQSNDKGCRNHRQRPGGTITLIPTIATAGDAKQPKTARLDTIGLNTISGTTPDNDGEG